MLDSQLRRKPVDSAAYAPPGSRASVLSSIPPPVVMEQHYQPRYHPLQHQHQNSHPHHHPHPHQHPVHQPPHYSHPHPQEQYARRVPSINTSMAGSPTADIRRSSSSRSGGAPTSYVAALRRQKGTVWSDRAQPEDPARAAQLRAAKARATRTMAGTGRLSAGHPAGRTSTGISTTGKVAAKIRHHGKPGVVGYAPGENHVGVGGVPPRLSATEVEGESSDDDERERFHHRRTGSSGRSSTGSGRRTVPVRSGPGSQRGTPSRQGSIAESIHERPPLVVVGGLPSDAVSGRARSGREGKTQSVGSGSSAERGDGVAELEHDPTIASNSRLAADSAKEKGKGGLERKGSVDERTSTLSAGRLYIANPD